MYLIRSVDFKFEWPDWVGDGGLYGEGGSGVNCCGVGTSDNYVAGVGVALHMIIFRIMAIAKPK